MGETPTIYYALPRSFQCFITIFVYFCRLQAELDEAKRKHREELTTLVAKTKQAANLELSMQRHEFEDKLAELEKALVGLKPLLFSLGSWIIFHQYLPVGTKMKNAVKCCCCTRQILL